MGLVEIIYYMDQKTILRQYLNLMMKNLFVLTIQEDMLEKLILKASDKV